ncbi:MAG: hypothetical protein WC492_04630 [Candidatus Micrarchaeia archaeon]
MFAEPPQRYADLADNRKSRQEIVNEFVAQMKSFLSDNKIKFGGSIESGEIVVKSEYSFDKVNAIRTWLASMGWNESDVIIKDMQTKWKITFPPPKDNTTNIEYALKNRGKHGGTDEIQNEFGGTNVTYDKNYFIGICNEFSDQIEGYDGKRISQKGIEKIADAIYNGKNASLGASESEQEYSYKRELANKLNEKLQEMGLASRISTDKFVEEEIKENKIKLRQTTKPSTRPQQTMELSPSLKNFLDGKEAELDDALRTLSHVNPDDLNSINKVLQTIQSIDTKIGQEIGNRYGASKDISAILEIVKKEFYERAIKNKGKDGYLFYDAFNKSNGEVGYISGQTDVWFQNYMRAVVLLQQQNSLLKDAINSNATYNEKTKQYRVQFSQSEFSRKYAELANEIQQMERQGQNYALGPLEAASISLYGMDAKALEKTMKDIGIERTAGNAYANINHFAEYIANNIETLQSEWRVFASINQKSSETIMTSTHPLDIDLPLWNTLFGSGTTYTGNRPAFDAFSTVALIKANGIDKDFQRITDYELSRFVNTMSTMPPGIANIIASQTGILSYLKQTALTPGAAVSNFDAIAPGLLRTYSSISAADRFDALAEQADRWANVKSKGNLLSHLKSETVETRNDQIEILEPRVQMMNEYGVYDNTYGANDILARFCLTPNYLIEENIFRKFGNVNTQTGLHATSERNINEHYRFFTTMPQGYFNQTDWKLPPLYLRMDYGKYLSEIEKINSDILYEYTPKNLNFTSMRAGAQAATNPFGEKFDTGVRFRGSKYGEGLMAGYSTDYEKTLNDEGEISAKQWQKAARLDATSLQTQTLSVWNAFADWYSIRREDYKKAGVADIPVTLEQVDENLYGNIDSRIFGAQVLIGGTHRYNKDESLDAHDVAKAGNVEDLVNALKAQRLVFSDAEISKISAMATKNEVIVDMQGNVYNLSMTDGLIDIYDQYSNPIVQDANTIREIQNKFENSGIKLYDSQLQKLQNFGKGSTTIQDADGKSYNVAMNDAIIRVYGDESIYKNIEEGSRGTPNRNDLNIYIRADDGWLKVVFNQRDYESLNEYLKNRNIEVNANGLLEHTFVEGSFAPKGFVEETGAAWERYLEVEKDQEKSYSLNGYYAGIQFRGNYAGLSASSLEGEGVTSLGKIFGNPEKMGDAKVLYASVYSLKQYAKTIGMNQNEYPRQYNSAREYLFGEESTRQANMNEEWNIANAVLMGVGMYRAQIFIGAGKSDKELKNDDMGTFGMSAYGKNALGHENDAGVGMFYTYKNSEPVEAFVGFGAKGYAFGITPASVSGFYYDRNYRDEKQKIYGWKAKVDVAKGYSLFTNAYINEQSLRDSFENITLPTIRKNLLNLEDNILQNKDVFDGKDYNRKVELTKTWANTLFAADNQIMNYLITDGLWARPAQASLGLKTPQGICKLTYQKGTQGEEYSLFINPNRNLAIFATDGTQNYWQGGAKYTTPSKNFTITGVYATEDEHSLATLQMMFKDAYAISISGGEKYARINMMAGVKPFNLLIDYRQIEGLEAFGAEARYLLMATGLDIAVGINKQEMKNTNFNATTLRGQLDYYKNNTSFSVGYEYMMFPSDINWGYLKLTFGTRW